MRRQIDDILPWQRTLYIMFAVQFMAAVGFSSIFPFLPLYVRELGSQTSLSLELLAGLVYSGQSFTMMIASPIWGGLADRYGRKLMVQRAMFGGALILLPMAFVRSAEQLVLLRTVQGFITGTVSATNAMVAAVIPRDRTGYAMGLLQVGQWGGIAMGPFIGGFIADYYGYKQAFFVTAFLLAAAGIVVWLVVKEPAIAPPSTVNVTHSFLAPWRAILHARGVTVAYLLRFLASLAPTVIVPVVPLFVLSLMQSSLQANTLAGAVVGVSAGASTIAGFYFGRVGDRVGHQRVLKICAVLAAVLYLSQSFVDDVWQLLVLQALAGAATGGVVPTLSALLASFTDPDHAGSVYGLDNSLIAGARAVAPLIGAAAAAWLGYRSAFVVAGWTFLVIALLTIWRLPASRSLAA